jgi:hypothetical protein
VTVYIQRTVGATQAAHIVSHMKQAGVPMGATGSGTLMLGSPAHLAVLVELAEEEARSADRE